jgi:3-methyl-2-oxobutanoate hydroxymethyltransferase
MSSNHSISKRNTAQTIRAAKGTTPVVCLTAYTAPLAQRLDPHVDVLLVGDSVGTVLYGMDNTVGVTLPLMAAHGKAVVRASTKACVVVDLPFGSYEASPAKAFESAAYLIKETGCNAVKLEGGEVMAETIAYLTARGIPVMSHIGLTPQHVHTMGYHAQGKTPKQQEQLLRDAKAVEAAGAFAVVLECVTEPMARKVTEILAIPTIGIGASPACDGQILVTEDMLGLTLGHVPKFVRQFADIGAVIEKAAKDYRDAVLTKDFPSAKECYGVPVDAKQKEIA